MKKKKQLSIRKLSLSKKTISFLDSRSSAQIVGGSDPYGGGCISLEIHCAAPSQYCTNGCPPPQTYTCPPTSYTTCNQTNTCNGCNGGGTYDCPQGTGNCTPGSDYTRAGWGIGC